MKEPAAPQLKQPTEKEAQRNPYGTAP